MLKKFIGKRKLALLPTSWLNAVANILNDIRSKSGTVAARVEGEGEGSNLNIDIVPAAAAREMRDELAKSFLCKDVGSLLGEGLKWSERGLTIDKEWLQREIVNSEKV